MIIQLVGSKVRHLDLKEDNEAKKDDFSFRFSNGFSENDPNSFIVLFDLAITSEHGYRLEISYEASFGTDDAVSQDFKESAFPVVNAPAIAYPYLRSFVSLITLNSGYEPMILPTINFQTMFRDAKQGNTSPQS